uniref:Uncharacterized protein n=1 Tax=Tanacetum cinerariifolium TaxID=118510 RepID=A0A699HW83_TANCI|nr:hypothetical protein [Tanacetum cinerariifolium]
MGLITKKSQGRSANGVKEDCQGGNPVCEVGFSGNGMVLSWGVKVLGCDISLSYAWGRGQGRVNSSLVGLAGN